MKRFLPGLLMCVALCGCGTSPVDVESTREVVLQYLGGDVGTAGPFAKSAKREIAILGDADRRKAEELIDRGAVVFLVFASNAGGSANRVVLVQRGRVVGDFTVAPRAAEPATPAAKPNT